MMHVAAWSVALLAGLFLPAAFILLTHLQGVEALLALSVPDMASLLIGLFLPPCLLLLTVVGSILGATVARSRARSMKTATGARDADAAVAEGI